MIFNSDALKQVQEAIFSLKTVTTNHATVYFKHFLVVRENFQNHLDLILDSKLNLFDHVHEKTKKATNDVKVIRKMNFSLPRPSLLIIYIYIYIYISFVRSLI